MFEKLVPFPDGNDDQSCYAGKLSTFPNRSNTEFGEIE